MPRRCRWPTNHYLMLRDRHGLIVKFVEEHSFNGIRLSPHVFNTEDEIDFAIEAIRNGLA
jgi:selenocysteine lyase/cysteine desulfurase